MTSYTYTAYGLNFASSFPLPYLTEATDTKTDITISYGKVPETLPLSSDNGIAWQAAPGKLLLSVNEVARYLILETREIVVEPLDGSCEDDVRIFLLGSVLGALLHAKRMLVLHASVIQTPHGAALFMGNSGAGKSTLLGAFLKRGYAMLADDKAGIVINQKGVAEALPGFPHARLTEETVEELNFPVEEWQFVPGVGKYVVPVKKFCEEPISICAAYSLNAYNKSEIRLTSPPPLEQFQLLNRHTYRRRFLHTAEQREKHFETLGVLSSQVKTIKVFRPDDSQRIEELADRIEENLIG